MKIKDIKDKFSEIQNLRVQANNFRKNADFDKSNELLQQVKQMESEIPVEFRDNDLIDQMECLAKSSLKNGFGNFSGLNKTIGDFKRHSLDLNLFPDDMDVEEAINRGNKLRSFQ